MELDIDLIVTNLTADLVAKGKLRELRFLKGNHERVEWILRHRELFNQSLGGLLREGLDPSGSGKCALKARQLRLDGNKLFSAKRFSDSISKYNQAILLAPSVTKPTLSSIANSCKIERCTAGDGTLKDDENQLALALANRSAALFHLKNYKEALNDIQEALKHGYPAKTVYKLFERRARCYRELGLDLESLAAIEEAIFEYEKHWIIKNEVVDKPQYVTDEVRRCKELSDTKTLERNENERNMPTSGSNSKGLDNNSSITSNSDCSGNEKSSHSVSDAVVKSNSHENCKKNESSSSNDLSSGKVYQSLVNLQTQLKSGPSKTDVKRASKSEDNEYAEEFFKHSASNSQLDVMKLQYSEQAGRYTISLCDIEPGRAISVEYPTASVLSSEYAKTHCYHCMKLVNLAYSCLRCSDVIFCSPGCSQIAWNNYHGYDCGTFMCKNTETVSKQAALAFRMLLIGGFKRVMDIFSGGETVEEKTRNLKSMETSYYDMVTTMTGHEDAERSDSIQLAMFIMAYYLLRLAEVVVRKSDNASTERKKEINMKDSSDLASDKYSSHTVQNEAVCEKHCENVNQDCSKNRKLRCEEIAPASTLEVEVTNIKISGDGNNENNFIPAVKTYQNEQLNSYPALPNDKVSCRLEATTVAECLNSESLQATEKLSEKGEQTELKFNESVILSALIRHLQLIQCNSFVLYDMKSVQTTLTLSKTVDSLPDVLSTWRLREIGLAIYPIAALVNHSCDPNVDLMFDGSRSIMRTIKKIKAGEEIVIDYGQTFLTHSKSSRQVYLSEQYFFNCQCIACLNDWPLSNELPYQKPTLLCSGCHKGIPNEGGVCETCGKERGKKDLKHVAERLSQSHDDFREAVSSITAGHIASAVPILSRHLANMQELLVMPWRDYYSCQAILRQCFRILTCRSTRRVQ